MLSLENILITPILFFVMGFLAKLLKSDLNFSGKFVETLAIYLMIGIGLKGGMELAHANLDLSLKSMGVALGLAILIPILSYAILRLGRLDKFNAIAISAHYGSVSIATFLAATIFLTAEKISYEPYPIIMLAVMESPAILIGLFMVQVVRQQEGGFNLKQSLPMLKHALTNSTVFLLLGSLFIGYIALPSSLDSIMLFYNGIFYGILSLFLLSMGIKSGERIHEFRQVGVFLILYGIGMPILSGFIGTLCAHYLLDFSIGGTILVATLSASASYVAVPSAMQIAVPEANPSFYLTLALGITFPFNILFGIPLYYEMAAWLARISPIPVG